MQELLNSIVDWVSDPELILVFNIVFLTLVGNYISTLVLKRLEKKAEQTESVWDDALIRSVRKPLTWLIWVLGISFAAEIVSAETETGLAGIISPVRYVLVVGLIALFLIRFISECEAAFIKRGTDVTTSEAIGKLLRVSVVITAFLSVLQTLGVSISGILAFGGIGGIAVGFAAQDLLANFFGGLIIYLDRPFAVGDWVRSPDRNVEGTVEKIGWRVTVIRTFDQRPLYVPNAVISSIALENPSRMRNRRISENVGVRYADVSKLKLIVDDIRQMLIDDPDMETDERTLIVNFNAFNSSSLDIFVYVFTRTINWVEFHEIKQRVLLGIHAIIEGHGAEIAFPTSTIHLARDEAAEAEPG